MKKIFAIAALSTLAFIASAQNKQIDSLKTLLNKPNDDTTRINILVNLSREYYVGKPDSGLTYATQALVIARKTGSKKGQIHALSQVGFCSWILGNYTTALQTFISSLNMANEINDQWSVARNYDGMSCVYGQENEFKLAIDYANRSEAIYWQIRDYPNVVDEMMGITFFYCKAGQLDSSVFVGKKALALAIKINEIAWRSQIYSSLGATYFQMHKTKLGLDYLYQGLGFAEKYNRAYNITSDCQPLAMVYKALGNRDSCIYFAKKEFDVAKKASFYRQVAFAADMLAEQYYGHDDHESARYYNIATTIKDSLFNDAQAKQILIINIAEQQHAAELKAAAVAFKGKVKLWGVLAALAIAIIISFILLKNNKRQHKANQLLADQKEEIEVQRDRLSETLHELKNTQTQLIQAEKMASLGELTAGIAHEIQNPLNFVNNFSEVNTELVDELLVELERGDLEEVKSIALDLQENERKVNMHGKRADSIVKGMLEHSRASTGQKEPTDINQLADEYLRLSYHGLRAKDKSFNAELITHFDEKLPPVNIIPQDMGRVLLNLFNNAFYAVHQKQKTAGDDYKPDVVVSTSTENNSIVIKVKDNGNGIPDAIKDKIMQPFFTTKPTGEGTGLGLSLSYDIVVKGHNGSINVESTEGQGSTFTIAIPA